MDWIFDNLQILFVIAAGLAYWVNSIRQAKAEAENERNQPPVDLDEVFGPDFDFNAPPRHTEVFLPPPVTASSQAAPPPLPGQRPQPAQRGSRDFPQGTPTPQRPKSPHQPASQEAVNAELERQRSLEQRILALRHNREGRGSGAAATQRSVVAERAARKGVVGVEPLSIGGIRSRLRDPREARRAIVLREILGTPVGMP
ncbi:MAG: hypothetical protein ACNA8L_11980 [Luteolibacter sp.]|jgi:hypothetical protein